MERYRAQDEGSVDRRALVDRHSIRLTEPDAKSPLQVGNGEFAFSVDVTGLQTFPDAYPVEGGGTLLGTQSQWGWHEIPSARPFELSETFRDYETPSGMAPYVDLTHPIHDAPQQTPAESWLRWNPHRLHLGVIGLWTGHSLKNIDDIRNVDQVLDLWSGVIDSRFDVAGVSYQVRTAVDPNRDAIGVAIESHSEGPVGLTFRFPYGSGDWGNAADWTRPEDHATVIERADGGWRIARTVDETEYWVQVTGTDVEITAQGPHDIVVAGSGAVDLVIEFGHDNAKDPIRSAEDVFEASTAAWDAFWSSGAAVDLHRSSDPSAGELERRVVLSQYVTRVNSSGSLPPAETGLMLNSWRGKFHLEMHWFHAAHFATWGRPEFLERSLAWYETILPAARATAIRQHHTGARWPKQIGPEGRETPSSIGPFLVWQQPHPIHLAELVYRAHPNKETLDRWMPIVDATAEFMASFPSHGANGYELGPPIIPSQESYFETRASAINPTFELAYWSWALNVAVKWRTRLGLDVPARWIAVSQGMAAPTVRDGIYAALGTPPYLIRDDHPSMLAGLGLVPKTDVIDAGIMSATLDDAWTDWEWESTWGWDYPVTAMAATRLGRPHDATSALLIDKQKNTYLANGHNFQTEGLPIYLPGNGSLLSAIGLMAAGWDDAPSDHPGFDSEWIVAHEGLFKSPA